jgi:5-methylcytosine-specific restriction enzyme A
MDDIIAGRNPAWVRDELILALDLYLNHSGDVPGKGSEEIESLSDTLNRYAKTKGMIKADTRFRNVNGVYMKLMNFRRLDPKFTDSGRVGLSRGGKLEEAVWAEFAHDPTQCRLAAEKLKQSLQL